MVHRKLVTPRGLHRCCSVTPRLSEPLPIPGTQGSPFLLNESWSSNMLDSVQRGRWAAASLVTKYSLSRRKTSLRVIR